MSKVDKLKYLGSTIQNDGECSMEVKGRVMVGWNGWRRVTGVICNRRASGKMKGKVYKTVVRLAMICSLEAVAITKRQEAGLEVAGIKMLRFSL